MILCCDDLVDEIYNLLRENNPFSLGEFDVCYFIGFFEEFLYGQRSPTTIYNELSFLNLLTDNERKRLLSMITSFLIELRKQVIDHYPDFNQQDYYIDVSTTNMSCNLIIIKGE